MPNIQAKTADENVAQGAGLLNPRFVRVDELDRLLDAISVVTTHLEFEQEESH
jgi:hypothetical protein